MLTADMNTHTVSRMLAVQQLTWGCEGWGLLDHVVGVGGGAAGEEAADGAADQGGEVGGEV